MTAANGRKKCEKQRASRTHGWGSPKKHRGAGSRGGRGNAGRGKKGQQKMSLLNSLYIKNIGKHGFINKTRKDVVAINLGVLCQKFELMKELELVEKTKDGYLIDMNSIGYDKLLGGGGQMPELKEKITIKASCCTSIAKEKIENHSFLSLVDAKEKVEEVKQSG